MVGTNAAVCNHCMIEVGQHRQSLAADEHANCSLCGRTHFEARGMYSYNGVSICSECVDLSLGQLEREEVDRFLTAW